MMTLPYGSTSCVRFQGSGTNPLSALTGSPSSDDYSERPLFCKEPFSSFFPLLFEDQQILKRTLRHMVHALRVAPVLHGAVSPHGFNAADFLLEAERQYEQRLKVLGDAQHLPDLARIKGQENAAAEVPRIRRQLDGLRGDARRNAGLAPPISTPGKRRRKLPGIPQRQTATPARFHRKASRGHTR